MAISNLQYREMLLRTQRNAGRNPPADSKPVEREGDLHADIMDHCTSKGWLALHGAMSRPTHRTEGEPDFIILADRGRWFMIECKSATGKITKEQREFIAQAEHNGHAVHVVWNMEQYLKVVA